MLKPIPVFSLLFASLLILPSALLAEEKIKSGPQVGERIATAFDPLNINGDFAGQPHCLVCENGLNPVVMIFAREPSEELVKLIAKVDAASAKHRKEELGGFAVFRNDKEGLDKQLAEIAKKNALKHFILSIDEPAGLEAYKIANEVDITVVLYVDHTVKANFAFKKGQLTEKDVDAIIADLPKILPKK